MMNTVLIGLLKAKALHGNPFEISVTGNSMNPILQDGQKIVVMQKDEYLPGDILVFEYKYGELLVHRLLKRKTGDITAKATTFRLEDFLLKVIGA
jgi:phage repressor protein C with HTH and peptisase S24 domain